MAEETYSFRFCDSNIYYLKSLSIYKHLKHIYIHNDRSIFIIIMLWKAQMQCLIEIVASHMCHMPSPLLGIGHPHYYSIIN